MRIARAALALAAVLALALPAQASTSTRPKVLEGVAYDQRLDAPVPADAAFRDEAGREIRFGDLFRDGKPVVLALAYYECPMLCTLVLNGLSTSLKTLSWQVGEEFRVVTVSIDPRETPELAAEKKKSYLNVYGRAGAEAGWSFLTGEEAAIRSVADAVGFKYNWDEKTQQFAHAAGVVVLTPDGRVSRYLYGVEFAPRDLRLALIEAADRKIGTVTDKLLLLCFHWDPTTGKYGGLAMSAVRAAGVLTIVGLGGFLITMWRRENRS